MGSCLSFLFNSHCPHDYDDCCDNTCYRDTSCNNFNNTSCTSNSQYQRSPYQQPVVRRYDLNNPNNYVCISCGLYHNSPYSLSCDNCLSKNQYNQPPKPSAPPL